MITFKEMVAVYHRRYTISATEAVTSVKLDREILDCREDRHHLKSIGSFNAYLKEMEVLGSKE